MSKQCGMVRGLRERAMYGIAAAAATRAGWRDVKVLTNEFGRCYARGRPIRQHRLVGIQPASDVRQAEALESQFAKRRQDLLDRDSKEAIADG